MMAGCSGIDQLDSWPFYAVEPETEWRPRRIQILGPIIEIQRKGSAVQWDLRPFVSIRRFYDLPPDRPPQFDVPYFSPRALLTKMARRVPPAAKPGEGRDAHQVHVLYPIYRHERCGPMWRTYLLPFYYNFHGETEDGEKWHHRAILPFYMAGRSDKRGSYAAVIPFHGTLKNMLGFDEIRFTMFPFYVHFISGERHRWGVLFPIISWSKGGGRESWYIAPFYGWTKRQDEPKRRFYLWPLFCTVDEPKEGERTDIKASVFFPFYAKVQRGSVISKHVMWPIYSHQYNTKTGRHEYVSPVWIRRWGWGPDYERYQFWPFYGRWRQGHVTRKWILYPFWQTERRETDRSLMVGRARGLIDRTIYREWTEPDGKRLNDYERTVWPFSYFKRDHENNEYEASLALRGRPDPHGLDRCYAALWRVYEYRKLTVGPGSPEDPWRSTRVLWEGIRYDRTNDSSFLRIFPLFSRRREQGELKSLEVLMGMFGYVDRPGKRTYRIFFVPWTVKREDDE